MSDPSARDDAPDLADDLSADLAYEPPAELEDEARGGPERPRAPRSAALKLAAVAAVALVIGAVLLAYRAQHRRKVVAAALARAEELLRLDTAAGFREAASLLEPISQLDPIDGASARAFALAMLQADYRERRAAEIEALLVAPGRADEVPAYAQLASAGVALDRREAGTAVAALARAEGSPWALALQARVALLAGSVDAALQPAAAAAAQGPHAAALSVHGDVLRRLGTDLAGARAAYEAALAASPLHPRSAYGLAKLALSGDAPAPQAERALRRLLEDRGTPAPERGRAALHLASLRLRAGDRAGAAGALDAAGLEPDARAWAERAAAVAAAQRGRYRAVLGAPASLRSASDGDPGQLSPQPPAPVPRAEPPARASDAPKKASVKRGGKASAVKGTHRPKATATKRAPAKAPPAKRTTSRKAAAKPGAKPGAKAKKPTAGQAPRAGAAARPAR